MPFDVKVDDRVFVARDSSEKIIRDNHGHTSIGEAEPLGLLLKIECMITDFPTIADVGSVAPSGSRND